MDSTDQAPGRRRQRKRPAPRPPEPRDWRWALGVLGRTLITLGLLILAFVVYQLWGTGIEFRANQSDLASEFRKAAASVATAPAPSNDVAPTDTAPDAAVTTTPAEAPTVPNATTTVTAAPFDTPNTGKPRWDVVAALKMPTISDTTLYVVNGVSQGDLKRGIGHYPGTAKPGEYGNLALAGHRTTYGAPFENLDQLQPGDRVIVDSIDGGHYEYIVESQEIIGPDEVRVLSRPTNPSDAVLTLTTCHPKRSTAKRLVVHARLDTAASTPLREPGAVAPPADPVSTAPPTTLAAAKPTATPTSSLAPTTASPTATTPGTTSPVATSIATASPATTGPTTEPLLAGDEVSEPAADALSTGWFDDAAAWPQIILWALPLIALGLIGRLLGRRWGRWWLGSLAVAAPFLVVLYFFFQNVNRLLPPGL